MRSEPVATVRRSGPGRFDGGIRLLQAGVDRAHDERADGRADRGAAGGGWAPLFIADMTEGKVRRWAELREK